MSKYDKANTVGEMEVIDAYLDPMEYVFWKGRGNKAAYIINNSMAMSGEGVPNELLLFIVPFFAIHLMPVWIWLFGMLKAAKKWKNSAYAVTDKQIIIKSAATGMCIEKYTYDKLVTVKIHRGLFDKLLGTSDLQFYHINGSHVDILDIKEADKIYAQVKQRIEETPCVRELHTETTAGQSGGHVCKDYAADFNPYDK